MAAANDQRLYAEQINYWRTSKSSPDVWLARTRVLIAKAGGQVMAEGYGSEPQTGRGLVMIAFELGGDRFKIVWPILPTKTGDDQAARRQAATMLHHDVKSRCISAKVLGPRPAFFSYLMLPGGQTVSELGAPDLVQVLPTFLGGPRALTAGEE